MLNDKDDVMHQGKTISQWEKDFRGEFTYSQLLKMAKSGCDLQKILMLGLDEAEKDIDDKQLFRGEQFFFNEADKADEEAALAESNNDVVVTAKDFVSQMKRNLANDNDKIMFRVNKKPYEVFDMHGKGGTFVVDLVPQVAGSLDEVEKIDETIIEDPDIDTASDLIDIINDATNGNINSSIVKIEDNTGREYNITSISGYRGDLYIAIAMKNAIRESKSMYKNYRDKIASFIDNGLLSWEEVGNECLQRMGVDEIKDMMQDCGWDDEPSLDESQKSQMNEDIHQGDFMNSYDLKRLGSKAYPNNKEAWIWDSLVGVVDGKVVDFKEVEHFKPDYPGEGTFFLLDGTEASRKAYEKEKDYMAALNENRYWHNGGYGGTGRSYRSYGELGAPRGKAISWFEVAELDPKARGKMKEWRAGPSNFPFKDLLYPERKYKIGTTVLRSKFLKAGDESGVKYIAIPSYFSAITTNDVNAINLLKALNIPLDLTFGMNPNDDYSSTYTI